MLLAVQALRKNRGSGLVFAPVRPFLLKTIFLLETICRQYAFIAQSHTDETQRISLNFYEDLQNLGECTDRKY